MTSEDLARELRNLKLQVADEPSTLISSATPITLIIGTDYYWNIVTGEIERLNNSLVAINTLFGWSVHGPSPVTAGIGSNVYQNVSTMKVSVQVVETEDELVSQQLKRFWELESMGITEGGDQNNTSEKTAVELHESTVKYNNNKYCVSLPWKPGAENVLTNNKEIAEKRFNSLVSKFRRDPVFYSRYQDVIRDYMKNGIVEKVSQSNEVNESTQPVYYLPHNAVVKEDRCTTKVRVVFDASCKGKGQLSLNDCLYSGPNLNPCLFGLLIRFRENKIAFCADLEKAFLQIELAEKDRDVARFLWTENPFVKNENLKIETMRLTRVLFGVTSSPFLLAATIKHHLKKYEGEYPETCKMLNDALYVDDLIDGADDEDEAQARYHESRKIMQQAGMNLRKWSSNSEKLQAIWKDEDPSSIGISTTSILGRETVLKVLGIAWDVARDVLLYDTTHLTEILTNMTASKRGILSASARIFDPLGILSPFVIRMKILFQEIWILGLTWDDPLPEKMKGDWKAWRGELANLKEITVPRYYWQKTNSAPLKEIQLHAFCDSSQKAYGAVLYLRAETEDGEICISFVCSKNRVAPIKKITLPRLELMGCLLAARLSAKVTSTLRLKTRCFYWTDSTVAYFWIKNSSQNFKQFVENRVKEIQSLSDPETWNHCPGDQNPADILSRGATVGNLARNNIWWFGPVWLSKPEENWPKQPTKKEDKSSESNEWRRLHQNVLQHSCNAKPADPVLNIEKYSSLLRLLRITAWMKRFTLNALQTNNKVLEKHLTADEIRTAEIYWIKKCQESDYKEEVAILKSRRTIPIDSTIKNLNPFLDDDGILRVGGRLHKSTLSNDQKHPIILHGKSKFTELLIRQEHQRVMHCGVADTLAQIRRKFWITKGRQVIKKIIHKCIICSRFSAKPGLEETAPLPKERIEESPPFLVTGVDFAGPLYIKTKQGEIEKPHIALFTCATTRAVHLELVSDMSTDMFLLAFKRFVSRRGVCRTILSDNSKTFKSAERNLKEMYGKLKEKKVQDYFANRAIVWKYITPLSPWQGGFWERMVRSTKTCLKKVLGKAQLSFEEMTTLLCEVEAILNSRPLTHLYNESSEPEPLTPSHFLAGRDLITTPEVTSIKLAGPPTKNEMTKRHEFRSTLLKHFWNRWSTQYLADLRSAHQLHNTKSGHAFEEGNVVLVADDVKNRMLWKMGVVARVYCGRDNKVRSCDVRLSDRTVIKRPIQLLYYMELV